MAGRSSHFAAGLGTGLVGLVLLFNPHFWGSLNPAGKTGLVVILAGAVIAVMGAVQQRTLAMRTLAVLVAMIPLALVGLYLVLLFVNGGD